MSDNLTLGKRRTVRFAAAIDQQIAARAASENKSISDVIRRSVLTGLQTGELSAGEWILQAAGTAAPLPANPERLAFRKQYQARHA